MSSKTYAVLLRHVDPSTRRPGNWVMSVHATREAAWARLQAYIASATDASWDSRQSLAQWLPGSAPLTVAAMPSFISRVRIGRVENNATARDWYTGPVYVRRTAHLTKKTG